MRECIRAWARLMLCHLFRWRMLRLKIVLALTRETGQRIWDELRVPVYFYEAAALRPVCAPAGERAEDIAGAGFAPDIGDARHPTAGYCVVGAREFLVAWNIILDTAISAWLARSLAGSGNRVGACPP